VGMIARNLLVIAGLIAFSFPAASQQNEYQPTVQPGDTLSIRVWGGPDIIKSVRVRADGKIALPLVGDATAAGLSTRELAAAFSREYAATQGGAPKVAVVVTVRAIHRGDTVTISVWNAPELTMPSMIVRSDGKITLPLLGDLMVAGLTTRELSDVCKERFGEAAHLSNPRVQVTLIPRAALIPLTD
jgi:protein involved in polysaccharide export with SLBB domain